MATFSQRYGYADPPKDIAFRKELPIELRPPIVAILQRNASCAFLRELVTELFDPYGINPPAELNSPIQALPGESTGALEFRRFLLHCPWFQVYELIERLLEQLVFHERELGYHDEEPRFFPLQKSLNAYFIYAGIGWQLSDGKVIPRGDEGFQQAIEMATAELQNTARPTAANHIRSAIEALSKRPDANTPGAVSHATSAVESLLNDITGQALTLGKYLDRHSGLFHPSMKKALDGVYGYACDAGARHGKEGIVPSFDEAQFAVATCAAACTLLTVKNPKSSK